MSSMWDPRENAATYVSPPATDHDIDDDAPSEVSEGEDLRGDLEDVLTGDFDFVGKFAFSETFTSTPLPGLHVEGVGMIGFPLTERDAKLIEAAATQAPFGKGTETVVDTTVRDTFEINPDKFSFKNSAWNEFLQTLTKKVAIGLGLPPNLPPPRADLYKLLLYKTGSHFLPHKDTEKTQGMFASLIIVLPSKFEGGELYVSHGDDKDVFNISPSSEFTTSALAWYTDVVHEVKPVTSGYRLAISYNLVNTLPGIPPPQLQDVHSTVSAVEGVFRKWRKGGYNEQKRTIAYLLDHQYSNASLEFAALKGKDATLVSNIRGVAEKQGVSLRLGLLECEISGDAGSGGWGSRLSMEEVHDTSYTITGLYDLEGDLVKVKGRRSITLCPEEDMIPQDPGFENQVPDDEDFEGYTGNEGAPMTHWYRRSVLVMFLAGERSEMQLEMGGTDYALKKLERRKVEGLTERNRQMVQFVLEHGTFGSRWSSGLTTEASALIDLALEWGDFTIWQETLKRCMSGKHTPLLGSDVLIRAWSVFTFDRTKHWIEQTIRKQSSTKAAIEFINAIRTRVPAQDPNSVTWWKHQTTMVLSKIEPQPSLDDVQMFIGIAKSEGLLFFSQSILNQLVEFRHLFNFWVSLAEGLWKNKHKLIPSGGSPEETSMSTTTLTYIIDTLIVVAIPEYSSEGTYGGHYGYNYAYTGSQDLTHVLQLLDLMALTNRIHHSGRLITLVSQSQSNLLVKHRGSVASFVPELRARYKRYGGSGFPMLDALLRVFVERWLQDLLGTPSNRPDASVKKLACGCQDCASINRFLRSDVATETFWAAQRRRSHVEKTIGSSIPGTLTCNTIMRGSPHGLQMTKTQETLTANKWSSRVGSARVFLSLIGTPDELARIMGDRYQDVQAALAGTKPYKMGQPAPIVVPAVNAPVASTSAVQATVSGTQTGQVMAGMKRKAEDGDIIDLTSD